MSFCSLIHHQITKKNLNIKAEPLVEVKFFRKFDLINGFLQGSSDPNAQKVAEKLREHGVFSITGTFDVDGTISFEDQIRYHILPQSYSFGQQIQSIIPLNNKTQRLINSQITTEVTLDGKVSKEFLSFTPLKTKIEGVLQVKLKGGAAVKLCYGISPGKGLYVEQVLVFSGIKGTFTGNIKAKKDDFNIFDKEIKPINFTLIEPKEYPLFRAYLFNQEKQK